MFVGMDLHKNYFQIAVMNEKGKVSENPRIKNNLRHVGGLGASSTVHDRFQEWRSAGVFKRMWFDGLSVYDKKIGIDWKWQAMDGVITKAPLGGKRHRCKSHRQS
jgi:hypothetical protein